MSSRKLPTGAPQDPGRTRTSQIKSTLDSKSETWGITMKNFKLQTYGDKNSMMWAHTQKQDLETDDTGHSIQAQFQAHSATLSLKRVK